MTTTQLNRKSVTELVRENLHVKEAWRPTERDCNIIQMILDDKKPTDEDEIEETLNEFIRIDSKTDRLLINGYMVSDGDAYFANEADAVEYLNANGFECTTFNEAYEASERGELDDTFMTDWYEPKYS